MDASAETKGVLPPPGAAANVGRELPTSSHTSTSRETGRTGPVQRRVHTARLYPTSLGVELLDQQGHSARALWNLLHEWYTWGGLSGSSKRPPIAEVDRQLRDARRNPPPGWEWLGKLPAQAAQQVLKHYVRAWDRFFKGVARPPKFKKRSGRMAMDIPQASKLNITRLNHHWGEVTIPLVGRVRFRWTRPLAGVSPGCAGRITGARLIKKALGWHICFRIEEPAIQVTPNPGPAVGIDRGVVHTMALSNGEMLNMPRLLRAGEERRLKALERKAARQQLTHERESRDPSDRYVPTSSSRRCVHGELADVTTGFTRPLPSSPRTTA